MTSALNRISIGQSRTASFEWLPPFAVVLLLAVGAVAALLAGLPSPDVIGADGMAGTWLGTP
jgi:hypothetical protein